MGFAFTNTNVADSSYVGFFKRGVSVNSLETTQIPIRKVAVSSPTPTGNTNDIHVLYAIESYIKNMIIYQDVSIQMENSVHHRK